jgi:hypothetical protein
MRALLVARRTPMNRLYIGLSKEVELPDGGFLFIDDDEIPNIPDWKRPKIFDPLKHRFNPLKDIGLLLIAQFRGQLMIPSFGFYGRDAHVNLIEEDRLIAGVNTLGELSPLMRQNMLLFHEKMASGAIADDAEELAKYQGLLKGTNAFDDFVEKAIAQVYGKKRPPIEAAKIGRRKE